MRRRPVAALGALLAVGCSGDRGSPAPGGADSQRGVPVAIDGESPFRYPPVLYDRGVEGEVRLRLFVDALGRVRAESTRVVSSSGTPAFDSAAVAGAARLRFAPARRDGQPVGVAFLQPVVFRRSAGLGGQPHPRAGP
ncbi:MAG: energy transducer TonB [Gemmatimonadetes bacterium]|nr:energy transducer TonB [Gemmatimonadota bacterium]